MEGVPLYISGGWNSGGSTVVYSNNNNDYDRER